MDAMMRSIIDFEQIFTGYGNHAFLTFLITDGEENQSKHVIPSMLSSKLASLPNNFTVACLLPSAISAHEAKKYGISAQNISIWDTSSAMGVSEINNNIHVATDLFFDNRAAGIVTNGLFKLDTSNLNSVAVQQTLQELNSNTYKIYDADSDSAIKAFVENKTGSPYVKGHANYLLNKKEMIQSYKKIYIRERATGKVYGGDNARTLLKLPLNQDIDVRPDASNGFDIFVESTSVNRKVVSGSSVLVIN